MNFITSNFTAESMQSYLAQGYDFGKQVMEDGLKDCKYLGGKVVSWVKGNVLENPPALIFGFNTIAVVGAEKFQNLSASFFRTISFGNVNYANSKRLGALAFTASYLGVNYLLFKTSELSGRIFGLAVCGGFVMGAVVCLGKRNWTKKRTADWDKLSKRILTYGHDEGDKENPNRLTTDERQTVCLKLNWSYSQHPFCPSGKSDNNDFKTFYRRLTISQMREALKVMEQVFQARSKTQEV